VQELQTNLYLGNGVASPTKKQNELFGTNENLPEEEDKTSREQLLIAERQAQEFKGPR